MNIEGIKKYKFIRELLAIVFLYIFYKKTMFFMNITKISGAFPKDVDFTIPYISLLVIIILPFLFFKGRMQIIYLLFIDIIYSIFLFINIIYFRETGDLIKISTLFIPYIYEPISSLSWVFELKYLMYFSDIPIILLLIFKLDFWKDLKRNISVGVIGTCIVLLIVNNYKQNIGFMRNYYNTNHSIMYSSPLGYLYNDLKFTNKVITSEPSNEETAKVESWMKWNDEKLPDNEYKGQLKGKNIFFLQVESLEEMVINQEIEGQEITPNINKLVNSGIYFPKIYEQNNGGNTADAEFMSNTSILPLPKKLTFMEAPDVKYNSVANLLKKDGYITMGAHPEGPHDYFWSFNYRSLGIDNLYNINNMNVKGRVGYYVSDEDFLRKYLKEIENLKGDKPIFSMAVTISSHGPFDIAEEYRYLNMSDELYKNRLGEYFQAIHYADKQIGMFIDGLDEMGILEDSVIVLFGDHGGPHKYYPDLIKNAPVNGDWWKEDKMTVPLVIAANGLDHKVVDKHGGLIDLPPTILYLLGIDNSYMMGRNLLNTNRDATIYLPREDENGNRPRTIIGNVQNDEERRRLEEAYDIGEIIIRTRYLEKQNKLNY